MSAKPEGNKLTDEDLKRIINMEGIGDINYLDMATELLSLRQQVKDWREYADTLNDIYQYGNSGGVSFWKYQALLDKYPETIIKH